MSTRSLIGTIDNNGKCKTIYCHHDGYLEYVGEILKEYYPKKEDVENLFELGDLSSLGENLEECIAYHRDYKEEFNPPTEWESQKEIADEASSTCWAEYIYLHDGQRWNYFSYHKEEEGWKVL